jgi:Fic family protein
LQSEKIEGGNQEDLAVFVKNTDVKIMELLPIEFLNSKILKELEGDYDNKIRELYKKIILEAINTKTGEIKRIKNVTHLYALNNIIDLAQKARCKIKKGKSMPLTHYLIMDTNKYLFPLEIADSCPTIGAYRSPYCGAHTYILNAKWKPAKSAEVSDKMDALLEWYNNGSQDLHPIERSAILHTEFIKIHPFEDGNGRTARLLVNYELTKYGYPTVVIKARDKDRYINCLEEAIVTKDVSGLVNLISDSVVRSEKKHLDIVKEAKSYVNEK